MHRDRQLELFPLDPDSAVRRCFHCRVQPIPLDRTICRCCVLAHRGRTGKQAPVASGVLVGERADA